MTLASSNFLNRTPLKLYLVKAVNKKKVINFITLCEYGCYAQIKTLGDKKICKAKMLFWCAMQSFPMDYLGNEKP